jgi:hypothetical protein
VHLFVDISSHGYGHLAITAPILAALADREPHLRLTVRSALPEAKLRERIPLPFELIPGSSDFGYVMHDALAIDRDATARAYRAAHADWPGAVAAEADFLAALAPDALLTNVAYRPLAGAAACGIPAFAACSLNWADLFAHFYGDEAWALSIHAEMLAAYRSARAFIRITPGMAMAAFGNVRPVGPVATRGRKIDLGLDGERAVLVAMGGIAHHLPVDHWPRLSGVRWLVAGHWQCTHPDAIAWESFGLDFNDLLCSADAVITKPGYGTFAEAACNGIPVLYQRRPDWPEQEPLIDWLHQQARCAEVSANQLAAGGVGEALHDLWSRPAPPSPEPTGAAEAAAILLKRESANS